MGKRYWILLLSLSFFFVISAANIQAEVISMTINNGAAFTDKPTVTLNTNFNDVQLDCCQYFASELPNNPNPKWKPVKVNHNTFQLSEPANYGKRTVYMMVRCAIDQRKNRCTGYFSKASVMTLTDTIEYMFRSKLHQCQLYPDKFARAIQFRCILHHLGEYCAGIKPRRP
jgi:hypothetical protein